jgi:hypothetical protein
VVSFLLALDLASVNVSILRDKEERIKLMLENDVMRNESTGYVREQFYSHLLRRMRSVFHVRNMIENCLGFEYVCLI